MGIWEGLKRGTKALIRGDGPGTFVAGGQKVTCPHCKSGAFFEKRAGIFATVILPYGSGEEATTLRCGHCGLIQWYGVKPERLAAVPERPEGANDA
jgi:hypothetical protein